MKSKRFKLLRAILWTGPGTLHQVMASIMRITTLSCRSNRSRIWYVWIRWPLRCKGPRTPVQLGRGTFVGPPVKVCARTSPTRRSGVGVGVNFVVRGTVPMGESRLKIVFFVSPDGGRGRIAAARRGARANWPNHSLDGPLVWVVACFVGCAAQMRQPKP